MEWPPFSCCVCPATRARGAPAAGRAGEAFLAIAPERRVSGRDSRFCSAASALGAAAGPARAETWVWNRAAEVQRDHVAQCHAPLVKVVRVHPELVGRKRPILETIDPDDVHGPGTAVPTLPDRCAEGNVIADLPAIFFRQLGAHQRTGTGVQHRFPLLGWQIEIRVDLEQPYGIDAPGADLILEILVVAAERGVYADRGHACDALDLGELRQWLPACPAYPVLNPRRESLRASIEASNPALTPCNNPNSRNAETMDRNVRRLRHRCHNRLAQMSGRYFMRERCGPRPGRGSVLPQKLHGARSEVTIRRLSPMIGRYRQSLLRLLKTLRDFHQAPGRPELLLSIPLATQSVAIRALCLIY